MRAKLTQTYIDSLKVEGDKCRGFWVNDTVIPGLRLYVGISGIKTYYVTYRNKRGKKDSFKLGDTRIFTPKEARDAARLLLAEMAVKGTDVKHERRKNARPTVRELVTAFSLSGRSEYTVKMVSNMTSFIDREAEGITPLEIETWRVKEKARTHNRNASINKKVCALKSVLNFAVQRGLISQNPISSVQKLKETDSDEKTRYLTDDERARLMAALDEHDREKREERRRTRLHAKGKHLPDMKEWTFADYLKPIILVSLNTGIRRHALLSLRWCDIDLIHKTITLQANSAKNRRSAILPMNKTVYQTLLAWYKQREDENNPLVFPSPQTGGIMDNCDSSFRALLKAADIHNFRWHDMRHDFASRLVMAGVDLNTVRELMTHSDISMTLRYAHLSPEKKRDAVEKV